MHTVDIVEKIKKTGKIPKGLYVSSKRSYASGYWSLEQDRVLFSAIIDDADVRKESHYDWKTTKNAKVTNVKTY